MPNRPVNSVLEHGQSDDNVAIDFDIILPTFSVPFTPCYFSRDSQRIFRWRRLYDANIANLPSTSKTMKGSCLKEPSFRTNWSTEHLPAYKPDHYILTGDAQLLDDIKKLNLQTNFSLYVFRDELMQITIHLKAI